MVSWSRELDRSWRIGRRLCDMVDVLRVQKRELCRVQDFDE